MLSQWLSQSRSGQRCGGFGEPLHVCRDFALQEINPVLIIDAGETVSNCYACACTRITGYSRETAEVAVQGWDR